MLGRLSGLQSGLKVIILQSHLKFDRRGGYRCVREVSRLAKRIKCDDLAILAEIWSAWRLLVR